MNSPHDPAVLADSKARAAIVFEAINRTIKPGWTGTVTVEVVGGQAQSISAVRENNYPK